jgi:glycosyltransferase involved in cell wall biosynthesis
LIDHKVITVVLPAFRAERTLVRTVSEIPRNIVDHIILVDDHSPDGTAALAASMGLDVIQHTENRGYGGNQKTCYRAALEAGSDIIIMLHPDYQYSPKLLIPMAGMIASGHYDAVLASRILGGHALDGGMPLWKYVANRSLTLFQNLAMGLRLSEYHTGYRAWSADLLRSLDLDCLSDDFVFDNQMIAQATWNGFKFGEISCPTRYFDDASSINFKRSVQYGVGVVDTAVRYRLALSGLRPWPLLGDTSYMPPRKNDWINA